MGFSGQSPTPPHQYSEAIQLKLYQAFIFSIPILLAIILILLFYLFYLKRRAAGASSNPPVLPVRVSVSDAGSATPCSDVKTKLCKVLVDEYLKTRDPQCCVCLGEYEEKEEVVQVPSCKHVFHMDCIRNWLRNNATCPLCRAPIVSFHDDCSKSPSPSSSSSSSSHHREDTVGRGVSTQLHTTGSQPSSMS